MGGITHGKKCAFINRLHNAISPNQLKTCLALECDLCFPSSSQLAEAIMIRLIGGHLFMYTSSAKDNGVHGLHVYSIFNLCLITSVQSVHFVILVTLLCYLITDNNFPDQLYLTELIF